MVQRKVLVVVVVATMLAGRAAASCADFDAENERILKEASAAAFAGLGEDSAIREAARSSGATAQFVLLGINLDLMRDNKCQMPTRPLNTLKYMGAAERCARDAERNMLTVPPPSCDRSRWGAVGVTLVPVPQ